MPTTIEQLELEVQSSSTSAVAGIDALSASLSKLKNAVRGGVGLTSVANQVRNLDTALKSMDSSGADKIDKLASSLEKLKLRSISEPLNVYSPLEKDMPCISSVCPFRLNWIVIPFSANLCCNCCQLRDLPISFFTAV